MDLKLSGQRILITAGAAGLGLEMAKQFLAEGAKVHVIDIDPAAVERVASENQGLEASVCDIANREQVNSVVAEAVQSLGGLDVLINNAGISGPAGFVETLDPEKWDQTIDVNVNGMFNVTHASIPHLIASGPGSILNIASAAGRYAFPTRSPYATSKWAVVGFTRTLAGELGRHGIRANVICPGPMKSDRAARVVQMLAADSGSAPEEVEGRMFAFMSIKKFVDMAEVARTACFVVSPTMTSFTGAVIPVDGDCVAVAA